MSDIVRRLREWDAANVEPIALFNAAADEIERLQAVLERIVTYSPAIAGKIDYRRGVVDGLEAQARIAEEARE